MAKEWKVKVRVFNQKFEKDSLGDTFDRVEAGNAWTAASRAGKILHEKKLKGVRYRKMIFEVDRIA